MGLKSEFVLNEEDRKKYTHPKKKRRRTDDLPEEPTNANNDSSNSNIDNNNDRSGSPKSTMGLVMQQILTDYTLATVEKTLDPNVARVLISGTRFAWFQSYQKIVY